MISLPHTTEIYVNRTEADFDRACDEAYANTICYYEINKDGHSTRVKNWERTSSWISLEFVSYIRSATLHTYIFKAKAQRA